MCCEWRALSNSLAWPPKRDNFYCCGCPSRVAWPDWPAFVYVSSFPFEECTDWLKRWGSRNKVKAAQADLPPAAPQAQALRTQATTSLYPEPNRNKRATVNFLTDSLAPCLDWSWTRHVIITGAQFWRRRSRPHWAPLLPRLSSLAGRWWWEAHSKPSPAWSALFCNAHRIAQLGSYDDEESQTALSTPLKWFLTDSTSIGRS